MNYIDISNDLTPAFYKNKDFKKGQILIFEFEGSKTEFKIVRLNRSKKLCWVVETKLYSQREFDNLTYSKKKKLAKDGNV